MERRIIIEVGARAGNGGLDVRGSGNFGWVLSAEQEHLATDLAKGLHFSRVLGHDGPDKGEDAVRESGDDALRYLAELAYDRRDLIGAGNDADDP